MSILLDTAITPEAIDTNAVTEARRVISAEQASVEIVRDADATPSVPDAEAISVADIAGLDEAVKAQINERWTTLRLKAGSEAMNGLLLGDARTLRGIAMLAMQMGLFPTNDWAQEARSIGVDTDKIKSKHPATMAVAATFGLKPYSEDKKVAKQHGQFLDRWALAAERLKNLILALSSEELEKITFDESGVEAVLALLEGAGGINALAALQRKANRQTPDEREYQIDLAPAKVSASLEAAGRQVLLGGVEGAKDGDAVSLAFTVEVAGQWVSAPAKLALTGTSLSQALQSLAPVDPLVDTLGELLQVGVMIEEWETDLPKKDVENPSNSKTEMRLASRQFVLKPNGSIMIAPILTLESPVVVVNTKLPILGNWPKKPHHFQTFGRRKAEANIAPPERRRLFEVRTEEPVKTLGHARMVLTTSAATAPEDNKKDMGFLIEPLRSAQGNFPLDVRDSDFKPTLEFSLDRNAQQLLFGIVGGFKSIGDKPVTIKLNGTEVEFIVARKSHKLSVTAAKTGHVDVRAAHLRSVVSTIALLPLVGDLAFAIDPDGAVRIGFATARAEYAVFLPALLDGGKAVSNRYFTQITLD